MQVLSRTMLLWPAGTWYVCISVQSNYLVAFSCLNTSDQMFSFGQDCCLIPESPFYLEGEGGLFRYIEKRLKDNGHMVIVVAEGAGQKLIAETMQSIGKDASGNELLLDVGLWLSQKINVRLGYSTCPFHLLSSFCVCCFLLQAPFTLCDYTINAICMVYSYL